MRPVNSLLELTKKKALLPIDTGARVIEKRPFQAIYQVWQNTQLTAFYATRVCFWILIVLLWQSEGVHSLCPFYNEL
jgi:hypothetical protein